MDKVMNFRDLGGISTKDGRRVKKGVFFRSALLDEATEEDINYLRSLGLKAIFDYRDLEEIDKNKDIIYKRIGAKHLNYPNNITKGKVYKLQNGGLERAFIKVSNDDVCDFYSCLPLDNKGYKFMVEALINDEVPFLQHCTAGKDRAGIGSAILLMILGVGYEEILKDYLESEQVYDYIKNKMLNLIPNPFRYFLRNSYEPLFTVKKDFLDAAINVVMKKYDTLEAYLLGEYGLTEEKINEIRNKYTE